MYSIIKEFILPPGDLWLLLTFGLVLLCIGKRTAGLAVLTVGLAVFYALSTPLVSGRLNAMVQTIPALTDDAARNAGAQAIVVLSGGIHFNSPEYGGPTVDETTLERVRYAARLHRLTGLPLLVSGGHVPGVTVTLADAMKKTLEEDFGIADVMVEGGSRDTHENAIFSAPLLKQANAHTVILVTHASHMPRAVRAFSETGLRVIPAPTVFTYTSFDSPTSYLPRLSGLGESHYAIYELAGGLWYALRH